MPAFEIIALDPAVPQLRAPGSADTYLAPRAFDIQPGTLTTNIVALNVGATWNNAAVAFTAFRVNVTDAASAVASSLGEWQIGGVSRVRFSKNGGITVSDGTLFASLSASPMFQGGNVLTVSGPAGYGHVSAHALYDTNNSGGVGAFPGGTGVGVGAAHAVFWVNGSLSGGTGDLFLRRDAANILAQRNGTAVQTYRIFRSFIDGSNLGYTALTQDATTGFILDSVNTGSVGAPTNILDLRENGVSQFLVASGGVARGVFRAPSSGSPTASVQNNAFALGSGGIVRWSNSGDATGGVDIAVGRNAVGVAEVNNGTAGAFRDLKLRSVIQVPPASITLGVNGEWAVEMTSNTAGNLVYRGSDGVTRRAALTFL
jgi:hypothetical protein